MPLTMIAPQMTEIEKNIELFAHFRNNAYFCKQ